MLQARSPSQVCLTPKCAVRSLPLASNGSKRPPPENRCLLPQAPRVPAEGCTSFACAPSSSRARSKPNSKCLLGKHPDNHVWGPRPRGEGEGCLSALLPVRVQMGGGPEGRGASTENRKGGPQERAHQEQAGHLGSSSKIVRSGPAPHHREIRLFPTCHPPAFLLPTVNLRNKTVYDGGTWPGG